MPRQITQPHELFFATLGNEARWRIVHLLQAGPLAATIVARRLHLEQSLISHHLQRLAQCGFVHVERRGTQRIYRLNTTTIQPLVKLMDRHINTYCRHVLAGRRGDHVHAH